MSPSRVALRSCPALLATAGAVAALLFAPASAAAEELPTGEGTR